MARCCNNVHSYEPIVHYLPGRQNVVADYLSVLPKDNDQLTIIELESCDPLQLEPESNACIAETRSETKKIQTANVPTDSTEQSHGSDAVLTPKLIDYVPTEKEISWTLKELIDEQKQEAFCSEVREALLHGSTSTIPDLQSYLILNDTLYRRRHIDC